MRILEGHCDTMFHTSDVDYRVEGDFYAEPDDVMRGVALAPASFQPSAFDDGFGDWPDADCQRTKVADSLDAFLGTSQTVEWPHCPAVAPDMLAAGSKRASPCPGTPDSGVHRFQAGDVPPTVPADPLFRLERTTIVVNNSSSADAAALGNGLLEHLRSEASAKVRKLSRPKFSVRAHASCGELSCELKVRVYRQRDSSCAVEFQRRSGDSVAFGGVFRRAADHLLASGAQGDCEGLVCPGTPSRVGTPARGLA